MAFSISSHTLDKFTTFGDLLRFLRRRVGLTQTELARTVGYSHTQISRLEQNLRLPDIPTIESRFISALGLEEEPNAIARLLDLAARVTRDDAPSPGLCPYKGLNYFDEADAGLFVGREALTTSLVERVLSLALNGLQNTARFFAVVGASGSGKSSLVRAGLIAALRWNLASTDWRIHLMTPTDHPLASLAETLTHDMESVAAISTLTGDLMQDSRTLYRFAKEVIYPGIEGHLLLVVDQFEEVFSLCRTEAERSSFIENLLTASSESDGPVMVVIALRADFYAACASYPRLREALGKYQEYIGAMSDDEIKRAIEEPARRSRWELEPGLVDLLLHDVGHEPGALPLLSHALFETWQRRRGRSLTLSGYASSGGVRGAIAETAEAVFADQFTNEQRSIARRIFLRLTELSYEGTATDTRRRASFNELILKAEEESNTREVLKVLADARLITTSEDSAEVAHEALIREWPTLRSWLEENRESLHLHRQLTEAAQEWRELDRTPDLLYRGVRLEQAREWIAKHQDEINELEHEFLAASVASWEREATEREEGHQRELASAKKLAETQRQSALRLQSRNRVITTLGSIAVILAILAGTFGLQSRNEKRVATSRELASAAVSNLEVDPELSMLLALQALDTAYTREAEDVLHRALQSSRIRMTLSGHTGGVRSVDISPHGSSIAAASYEGDVTVWGTASGQKLFSVGGTIALYSPDGTRLATGNEDGYVTIWDVATEKELLTMKGNNKRVIDTDFSPDGNLLASITWDGSFMVWDTENGEEIFSSNPTVNWGDVGFDYNNSVAFSIDGKMLISISPHTETQSVGQKISFWAVDRDWALLNQLLGDESMLLSPDGRWLVSRARTEAIDGVALWDLSNIALENLDLSTMSPWVLPIAQDSAISDVAFSPDGSMLVSIGSDGMVNVWHLTPTGPELPMTFSGHTRALTDVAFGPDGTRLVTANLDGTVRLWDITPEGIQEWFAIEAHGGSISGLALTADGQYLATAHESYFDTAGPHDGYAKVWELASGKEILAITNHGGSLSGVAINPDAALLATAGEHIDTKIWQLQLASGAVTAELLHTLSGKGPLSVVFSPEGTELVTAGGTGIVRVWDPWKGQELDTIMAHTQGILGIAFSRDSRLLAIAGDSPDAIAKVWDVVNGEEFSTFSGHENRGYGIVDIAMSPDGRRVATVSGDGSIRIWDPRTGEELLVLIGASEVNGVDFSPDGRYLATVSSDGTATKWDATTGDEIVVYHGPGGPLEHVKITPDGKKMIIAGTDYIYGFIFDLNETISLARSRVTRWFTLGECRKYLHQEECPRPSG